MSLFREGYLRDEKMAILKTCSKSVIIIVVSLHSAKDFERRNHGLIIQTIVCSTSRGERSGVCSPKGMMRGLVLRVDWWVGAVIKFTTSLHTTAISHEETDILFGTLVLSVIFSTLHNLPKI